MTMDSDPNIQHRVKCSNMAVFSSDITWLLFYTLDRCVWHEAVGNSAGWVFPGCFQPCTASPWRATAPGFGARGWSGWKKGPSSSASGGIQAPQAAHLGCYHPTGKSANWEHKLHFIQAKYPLVCTVYLFTVHISRYDPADGSSSLHALLATSGIYRRKWSFCTILI